MKRLLFLTPAGALPGFRLSGAEQRAVGPEELAEALQQALAAAETGLLIIDERLATQLPKDQLRTLERRWDKLILVLPAPREGAAEAGEDYVLQLIRRAIGYHIRLNP